MENKINESTLRKPNALIYRSWHDALSMLTPEQYKSGMTMIMDYVCYDVEPETDDPILKMFLTSIRPQMDTDIKKYEASLRGGRPRKEDKKPDKLDLMFGGDDTK